MKKTYRQNHNTGKFEEVVKAPVERFHLVQRDIAPFVSPVDGTTINTRSDLVAHNKRNNVSQDTFDDRIAARTAERENLFGGQFKDPTRNADIRDAIERCRGEGDNRYRY